LIGLLLKREYFVFASFLVPIRTFDQHVFYGTGAQPTRLGKETPKYFEIKITKGMFSNCAVAPFMAFSFAIHYQIIN
jgi:hypothetical protein